MIKQIKSEARRTLAYNYKLLIIPTLMLMVSDFAIATILNYFTNIIWWSGKTDLTRLLILLIFVFFEFFMNPVSLALLYKVIITVVEDSTVCKKKIRNFISVTNMYRIVIINFIPRFISFFAQVNNYKFSVLNLFKLDGIPLILVSIISTFISYKFFACNYYFSLTEATVKQTLSDSFKIMSKNFFKWILLLLTFSGWIALELAIYIIIKMTFGDGLQTFTPIIDSLVSSGYGVGLYLTPYF